MPKTSIPYDDKYHLKPHEISTISFLSSMGFHIEIIRPSLTPRNKNPDILINNIPWEMKSPTTDKKTTIKRLLKEASSQSPNIIVDLRRAKIPENISIPILQREYKLRRTIRKLLIIKKDGTLLHYKK